MPERASRLVRTGFEMHLLVFERAPDPLDEHIVHPAAAAVHRDRDAGGRKPAREHRAGELRALVGVENIRRADLKQRAADGDLFDLKTIQCRTHRRHDHPKGRNRQSGEDRPCDPEHDKRERAEPEQEPAERTEELTKRAQKRAKCKAGTKKPNAG